MERYAPAIILVTPQMGENIGATARVMGNFGLSDLRMVAPRDGWPNPAAETMSAGAFEEGGVTAEVFPTLEDAVADLSYIAATTARMRGMEKPVLNAKSGAKALSQRASNGYRTGIMFGAEKTGLLNPHVALASVIVTYPVNSTFASLNLAQAVGVFAHEWAALANSISETEDDEFAADGVGERASRSDLVGMMEHFEEELESAGFFFPPEKKPVVVQNLRNMFTRSDWTIHEVRAFRGAVKALALGRGKARVVAKDE